jgi:hypothetical protein
MRIGIASGTLNFFYLGGLTNRWQTLPVGELLTRTGYAHDVRFSASIQSAGAKRDFEFQKRDAPPSSQRAWVICCLGRCLLAPDGTPHASRKVTADESHPVMAGLKRRTKKSPHECHFHFQPWVRPSIRVEDRNTRPIVLPTNPSEDRDGNELNQPGYRLFRLRNADHSEPASGRPEWSFRRQFLCHGRRHQRDFSGHGFFCRCLSLWQIL